MSESREYLQRDLSEGRLVAIDEELAIERDATERALLLLERASLLKGSARLQDSLAAYQAAPALSQAPLFILRELAEQGAHRGIDKILRAELGLKLDEARLDRAARLRVAAALARTAREDHDQEDHDQESEVNEALSDASEGAAKAALNERIARTYRDRARLHEALLGRERASIDPARVALFRIERLKLEAHSPSNALAMAHASELLGEAISAAFYYVKAASDPALEDEAREEAWLRASRSAPKSAFVQSAALAEVTSEKARAEIEARLNALDVGDPVDQLSEGYALLRAGKIKRARLVLERAYERRPSLDALLLLDRALELKRAHRARVSLIESYLGGERAAEERASLLVHLAAILEDELGESGAARERLMEAALGSQPNLAALARLLTAAAPTERLPLLEKLIGAHPQSELALAFLLEELKGRPDAPGHALHPALLGALERSPDLAESLRYLTHQPGALNPDGAALLTAEAALLKASEHVPSLRTPAQIAVASLALARGDRERATSLMRALPKSASLTPLGVALDEALNGARGESSREKDSPRPTGDLVKAGIEAELRGDEEAAIARYLEAGDAALALDGLRRLALASRSSERPRALERIVEEGAPGASLAQLELALGGDRKAAAQLNPAELDHALEILLGGGSGGARGLSDEREALDTISRAHPSGAISLPKSIFREGTGLIALAALAEDSALSERDRRQLKRLHALLGGEADEASLSLLEDAEASALDRAFVREQRLSSSSSRVRADAFAAAATETSGKLDLDLLSEAGWAALEAGDYKQALAAARRIVVLEPRDLSSLELLRLAAIGAKEFSVASSASLTLADFARGRRAHLLVIEAIELYLRSDEAPEKAADLFEECIRRSALTPETLRALSRRAEALDAMAQRERLLQLLSSLPDSHPLFVPCLLELAFIDRDRGALNECRRWLDQLGSSDAIPVEALELRAEIAIAQKRTDDAIRTLRECTERRADPAARAPLLGWLAKLLRERGDAAEAIKAYEALKGTRSLSSNELEELSHLSFQVGDLDGAIAANLEAAAKAGPAEAAAIHLRAAKVAKESKGGRELAMRLFRSALREVPTTIDAVIGLHQLAVNPAEQRRIEARIVELIDQRFPLQNVDVGFIRSISEYARAVGDPIRAAAATEALRAIGAILPDTFEEADEYTQVVLHDELDPKAILHALNEPAPLDDALAALAIIEGALERTERAETLGFTPSDRIRRESASPLRDELNGLASLFGGEELDLLRGGKDERALFFGRLKKAPAFFAGAAVKAPLSRAERFTIGAELYSYRRGSSAILGATFEELGDFAADLYRAAKGESLETSALKGLSLGFLERRSLRAALERCGGAEQLQNSLRALRYEQDRASLLAVGDLHETLRIVLGSAPDRERVEASARALGLFSFFIDKRSARFHRFYGAGQ